MTHLNSGNVRPWFFYEIVLLARLVWRNFARWCRPLVTYGYNQKILNFEKRSGQKDEYIFTFRPGRLFFFRSFVEQDQFVSNKSYFLKLFGCTGDNKTLILIGENVLQEFSLHFQLKQVLLTWMNRNSAHRPDLDTGCFVALVFIMQLAQRKQSQST